jgi:hypothetical protein
MWNFRSRVDRDRHLLNETIKIISGIFLPPLPDGRKKLAAT